MLPNLGSSAFNKYYNLLIYTRIELNCFIKYFMFFFFWNIVIDIESTSLCDILYWFCDILITKSMGFRKIKTKQKIEKIKKFQTNPIQFCVFKNIVMKNTAFKKNIQLKNKNVSLRKHPFFCNYCQSPTWLPIIGLSSQLYKCLAQAKNRNAQNPSPNGESNDS